MTKDLRSYVEKHTRAGFEIGKTIEVFRRYAYIEQSCVRALAGWFLKMPAWEAKLKLGYFLYAHAERAFELSGRMEELRGGHRDANREPNLDRAGEEIANAPDEASFVAGLGSVLRMLAEAYREYIDAANLSANATEIRMLRRLLADVESELVEVGELESTFRMHRGANEWADYLTSLFSTVGGIGEKAAKGGRVTPRPETDRFDWTTPMVFDERIQMGDLGSYESKLSMPLRDRCIGDFEVYFNELYAAAIVAAIIFDSWKISAPRQYFMDIAHHFWDEVRHAEFGAIRLRELGVEPSKVNMLLFEQSRNMPILHRICYLTLGLEVFFMPRKSKRARYYDEQGDALSHLFVDYDWSDEMNHVRYGKRWVEYFLKDDARSVEDVQKEISNYLDEANVKLPEGKMAAW